ncbi:MAG: hypothetical protein K0R69_2958 [Clostridia bacterium]|jgi:hypothetical protein|nr:hypothetical protein [Clostridia bacterium]
MIKQEKNYIAVKKKKFLIMTLIWIGAVSAVFFMGLIINGTRNTYFTLVAALFVLPLAQNGTRYLSFNRFKDPDEKHANVLEGMKGSYHLYHGAIVVDTTATVLFEHLIITSRNIYFLTSRKEAIEKHKSWLKQRLVAKGIDSKQVHFVHIDQINTVKNIALRIEKDACYTSEVLDQNSNIFKDMLM